MKRGPTHRVHQILAQATQHGGQKKQVQWVAQIDDSGPKGFQGEAHSDEEAIEDGCVEHDEEEELVTYPIGQLHHSGR